MRAGSCGNHSDDQCDDCEDPQSRMFSDRCEGTIAELALSVLRPPSPDERSIVQCNDHELSRGGALPSTRIRDEQVTINRAEVGRRFTLESEYDFVPIDLLFRKVHLEFRRFDRGALHEHTRQWIAG